MRPDPLNPFTLTLGDILRAAGIDPSDVLLIRHTYKPDGLGSRVEATPERVLAYTREQPHTGKIPAKPPRWWLIFMAEAGRRCRLLTVYDNEGEALEERTERRRYFRLSESELLESMRNRLLIEWSKDPVNWAKGGAVGARFRVVEIADPQVIAFPGYDNVLLSYGELQQMVTDSRYSKWQAALGAVQGIYLIADTVNGKLYVGKADGADRILGRWTAYARDGHGGNVAMRELVTLDPEQPGRYVFSILRVFGPQVPQAEVDAAEAHYKDALLTRKHGLNRN
ncbi:MAG: GIY-YIG nuclease family protein [Propionibacteriaceae bacterium]|nr:GIY-YIG nuclease family protein [Propionibacteriaceae bacterium]